MKLVLAKQDFRNSDAWSEVCDTLGLPDNTTQVEISASATKVRTVEHPAWEEKEFWQNLVAEHIKTTSNGTARLSKMTPTSCLPQSCRA